MPELPEVETVKNTLKRKILNKKIKNVRVFYDNIVAYPNVLEFKNNMVGKTIIDIDRLGKWLIFNLDGYYLLSHLRMEGKYFYRNVNDEVNVGQSIGTVANVLEAEGEEESHVHFELIKNGEKVDPANYIQISSKD